MSDASSRTELLRRLWCRPQVATSVQTFLLRQKQVPVKDASRLRTYRTRWQLQKTRRRLCSVRGAEEEIDEWFHNQCVMVDATQNKAPWTLLTHKSRILLHFPPSCITSRNSYDVLTAEDTYGQAPQGETVPAAHARNHKKKQWVLVVGDSLLRGTKAPICRPDRESREVCCLPGASLGCYWENATTC